MNLELANLIKKDFKNGVSLPKLKEQYSLSKETIRTFLVTELGLEYKKFLTETSPERTAYRLNPKRCMNCSNALSFEYKKNTFCKFYK